MDFIKHFKVTKEAGSQVIIEGEIPFEELQKERKNAIKYFGDSMELPGFRKGNVPENMVVSKVGEMAILSEMAERALSNVYPEVLRVHEIDAIGYPKLAITKIAPNNPLGFTATVAILARSDTP